jgi:transcriptional regulator with XRE-family HTH domain
LHPKLSAFAYGPTRLGFHNRHNDLPTACRSRVAFYDRVPDLQAKVTPRGGDPRDAEIGQRVRTLRLQRGLSQTELGSLIDVTFQQVQKYEKGTNRISAGRLQRMAEVLSVPVSFFFAADDKQKHQSQTLDVEFSFLQTEGALRLARAYARIKRPGVRLQLLRLAEAIAGD